MERSDALRRLIRTGILLFLAVLLAAVSCSKPDLEPDPVKPHSSAADLNSFRFDGSLNGGLSNTVVRMGTIQGWNIVFVTVPESTDITRLVPTLHVSEGATATIGGADALAGNTPCDFSDDVTVTVTAENGQSRTNYIVLVRKGNADIDALVYDIMIKYGIPGISVATTRQEQPAYTAAYGYADIDALPLTRTRPDMLFRLASVSKAQTALCIMTLYEEGLLHLNDRVFAPGGLLGDLYPGEHGAGVDNILVRHLLTHMSGWTYSTTGGVDPVFTTDSRFSGKTLSERIAYMTGIATSTPPGTTSSYYNLGFCILGQIIEKVTGMTYESYLQSVAAKVGVTDIWCARTEKKDRRSNECVYYAQGGNTAYGNDMSVVGACGSVIASAPGLMQLLAGEDYGTVVPDILRPETLDLMYTNYTTTKPAGYGFGWRIGHNTLTNWASYHGGNLAGTATIWVRGKNGVNGVLLCNSRSSLDDFDTALYVCLDAIMNQVPGL